MDAENPLFRFASRGRDAQEAVNNILARTRERVRRAKLQRQLEAQERKLDRIGPNPMGLRRDRAFRILAQIKRLKRELAQPELML